MVVSTLIALFCCLPLALSSCGFRPIYASYNGNEAIGDKLASIDVTNMPRREGQELRGHLERLFNPTAIPLTPLYRLDVKLSIKESPAAIQQDRSITRYQTIVLANYTLTSIADKKALTQGVAKLEGGYNRMQSEFATFAAKQDTTHRLLKEMAEELKTRMTVALTK